MIRTTRANWTGAILVCGKCSKKLGGGFGDDERTPLAKALRRTLELGKGRKAARGVIETRCLGVCPKRAVMIVDVARPGEWLIVPQGKSVDVVAALLTGGVVAQSPA